MASIATAAGSWLSEAACIAERRGESSRVKFKYSIQQQLKSRM